MTLTNFNEETWKKRAEARRVKAQRAGRSPVKVESQWEDDVRFINALRVVVEWCEARSLTVEFRNQHGGVYYPAYGRITISERASPKLQLHYLLHECGHHLVFSHPGNPNRFEMGYPQTDKEVTRKFQHRLACLEEEMEAWQRGRNLAKKLKLKFNEDNLESLRIHCLGSYVRWACKKK